MKDRDKSVSSIYAPFFLALCVFFVLPGCSSNRGETDFRIGVILTETPMNGENARIMVDIARLVEEETNREGGLKVGGRRYPLRLFFRNDGNNPEGAIAAARSLISLDRVALLIGPQFSNNAIPAGRIAEKARLPLIAPISTNPETTKDKRYVFRVAYMDTFQGLVMAKFVRETLRLERAAVLFDVTNTYNRGLAEVFRTAFEEAGGKVVSYEEYTADRNTDFTPQLGRIKQSRPDVLYLPNFERDAVFQAKQSRDAGIGAILLGGDGWSPYTMGSLPAFEGAYFTHHWHQDLGTRESRAFVELYTSRFGGKPIDLAALTYDAFGLALHAAVAMKSVAPERLRDGLVAVRGYPGVTGSISFSQGGDPEKGGIISKCVKGEFVFHSVVYPEPY